MTPNEILGALAGALAGGRIRVIDLTHTLSPEFPQIALPPEFGQCLPFRIEDVVPSKSLEYFLSAQPQRSRAEALSQSDDFEGPNGHMRSSTPSCRIKRCHRAASACRPASAKMA